ncbi:Z-DNA-binding protein 1 isoform X1 [Tamandua tetradactyla]|uniref:Z-DNA-binding protein 1 isoform X1 n=1 Tax=Tamandua tetradactyla TaxID=48850 RepID=UPI0040539E40
MAQAAADTATKGDLERKILQVLRDAGSPVKTAQLVKECQVPKKELNHLLYQMEKESKVALAAPATWHLGRTGSKVAVPAALAEPSGALICQQPATAVPPTPGPQLSQQQEAIYRLLEASGPQSALNIAQTLGLKRAKDVNPDLYAMRNKHLLSLDQNSKSWTIYQPGASGIKHQSSTVIYQQNPVNMIHQNGPNGHIYIMHSEATQIGHGNVMRQMVSGKAAGPSDASAQASPASTLGSQDIHVKKSVFRRVQLGHSNEMKVQKSSAEDPVIIPSGSPPVTVAAGPVPFCEVHIPKPGPHPEGDPAQRVHITSCFLEDTAIGSCNKMTVEARAARPATHQKQDMEENSAPDSEAAPSRSDSSGDIHQAAPHNTLTTQMKAVALGNRDPITAGGSGCAAGTPDTGEHQGGGI